MKVTSVAALMSTIGTRFKKVGGAFTSTETLESLLYTIEALGNVGRYDTTIQAKNGTYSIEDYKVDTKLLGLVKPMAICMPGSPLLTLDVRVHEKVDAKNVLSPAEFTQTQFELANMFKTQPSFTSVTEAIKPVDISAYTTISNGKSVHCDSVAAAKDSPVELTINKNLFTDAYFEYAEAVYYESLITNICLGMVSKG